MASAFSVLKQRDFGIFWTAAAISNAGGWMQIVALPEIVYEIRKSAAVLGLAALIGVIPTLLLAPIAGFLADRYSRRKLLIITQTIMMVVAFTLWGLYITDRLTIGLIMTLTVINGGAAGLNFPVWTSLIPTLVDRVDLVPAVRLNSLQFTAGRLVGPMAAAFVIGQWGPGSAIFTNAITFVLVLAALVVVKPRATQQMDRDAKIWSSVRDGATFVWRQPTLRTIVMMTWLAGIFVMGYIQQSPAVAHEALGRSDNSFNTVLIFGMGVGAVITSIFIITRGDLFRPSTWLTLATVGFIVGSGVLAATRIDGVGFVGYVILGMSQMAVNVPANSVMQTLTPDQMRGRVVSMYMLAALSGTPMGAQLIGVLADTTTMRSALMIMSIGAAVLFVMLRVLGSLHHIDAKRLIDLDGATTPASIAPGT